MTGRVECGGAAADRGVPTDRGRGGRADAVHDGGGARPPAAARGRRRRGAGGAALRRRLGRRRGAGQVGRRPPDARRLPPPGRRRRRRPQRARSPRPAPQRPQEGRPHQHLPAARQLRPDRQTHVSNLRTHPHSLLSSRVCRYCHFDKFKTQLLPLHVLLAIQ